MRACADFCRRGGWVTKETVQKTEARGGALIVQIPLHEIKGPLFFLQDTALQQAKDTKLRLAGIEKLLDAEKPDQKEIAARVRQFGDLRAILRDVEREAADGEQALHPTHLDLLVKAVERATGGSPGLRLHNGKLQVRAQGFAQNGRWGWDTVTDLRR